MAKMPRGKRISKEKKDALVERVRKEIEERKRDSTSHLSTNAELGDLIGAIPNYICRILKSMLTESERSYRKRKIHQFYGQETARRGVGVHGLSAERRAEVTRKAGLAAAEKGTGIHAQTHEQRMKCASNGGKKSAELGVGAHGLSPERKAEVLELARKSVSHQQRVEIGRAVGKKVYKMGIGIHALSHEERVAIGKRNTENGNGIHALTFEQRSANGRKYGQKGGRKSASMGVGIHGLTHEQRVKNSKKAGKIGGKKAARTHVGVHGLTHDQLAANSRKAVSMGVGAHGLTHEQRVEIGRRSADYVRKSTYCIDGRFSPASQQEGAVALLLEKYIPEFRIAEGVNFQVKDKGIKDSCIDFLVDGEFLEWHPICPYSKKSKTVINRNRKSRGDIPGSEIKSYKKVVASLHGREKREFIQSYKRVLAVKYRAKRQEAVDNSGYAGTNVELAGSIEQLYDFMQRHSAVLPTLRDFKSEFNRFVRYVKEECRLAKAS